MSQTSLADHFKKLDAEADESQVKMAAHAEKLTAGLFIPDPDLADETRLVQEYCDLKGLTLVALNYGPILNGSSGIYITGPHYGSFTSPAMVYCAFQKIDTGPNFDADLRARLRGVIMHGLKNPGWGKLPINRLYDTVTSKFCAVPGFPFVASLAGLAPSNMSWAGDNPPRDVIIILVGGDAGICKFATHPEYIKFNKGLYCCPAEEDNNINAFVTQHLHGLHRKITG
jgi:hypothetical protein